MGDNTGNDLAVGPNVILQQVVQSQQALQNAVLQLTHLQMAAIKATYNALPTTEQKGAYCASLKRDGYDVPNIAEMVDRSPPTVYRQISESK